MNRVMEERTGIREDLRNEMEKSRDERDERDEGEERDEVKSGRLSLRI